MKKLECIYEAKITETTENYIINVKKNVTTLENNDKTDREKF